MQAIRIIVLSGPPGVGKTEAGRRLAARAKVPAAALDADRVADVLPWSADAKLYRLLARNVAACLPGYREWGVRLVVLSAVLVPGRALDDFAELLADPGLSWRFFGLRADVRELRRRVHNDVKFQGIDERISWNFLDAEVAGIPGVTMIDTTDLGVEEVIDAIAAHEPEWFHQRRPSVAPARLADVRVPVSSVAAVAAQALERAGFPASVAVETVTDLLAAEAAGLASHGLLRVPEYVAAVADGDLAPAAEPQVSRAAGGMIVDGRNAPAVTVRRAIAGSLVDEVERQGFALVGLRDGAHLGRLKPLAEAVTAAGSVLLGYANFRGAGQKVAPPGAASGRLATNPMVFGCPAAGAGRPVILDMSTSTASEGSVRAAKLAGRLVSREFLRDDRGRTVRDPADLYSDPPAAFLTALGGTAAHKGFGLAVMVEVLAGIVAGGGSVAQPGARPGNAGLFLAFRADALGRDLAGIGAEIAALEEHLAAPPWQPEVAPSRLPGRGSAPMPSGEIDLPGELWEALRDLAASEPVSAGPAR